MFKHLKKSLDGLLPTNISHSLVLNARDFSSLCFERNGISGVLKEIGTLLGRCSRNFELLERPRSNRDSLAEIKKNLFALLVLRKVPDPASYLGKFFYVNAPAIADAAIDSFEILLRKRFEQRGVSDYKTFNKNGAVAGGLLRLHRFCKFVDKSFIDLEDREWAKLWLALNNDSQLPQSRVRPLAKRPLAGLFKNRENDISLFVALKDQVSKFSKCESRDFKPRSDAATAEEILDAIEGLSQIFEHELADQDLVCLNSFFKSYGDKLIPILLDRADDELKARLERHAESSLEEIESASEIEKNIGILCEFLGYLKSDGKLINAEELDIFWKRIGGSTLETVNLEFQAASLSGRTEILAEDASL